MLDVTTPFGTYPRALNLPGEPPFVAVPGTPSVTGLTEELLLHNPNKANPNRLSPQLWMPNAGDPAQESAQEPDADHAPSTAFQISGVVLFLTRSLPSLN